MSHKPPQIDELSDRSREVFRRIVESYLSNGSPVGSRALTYSMSEKVSAATVRNAMQDLEHLGLLDSPHISAGRVPTEMGLRMFVDGLLEISDPEGADRKKIDQSAASGHHDVNERLDQIGSALSGVTGSASLVLMPKQDAEISHVEFLSLSDQSALAILVYSNGHIENRLFQPPPGQTPSSLREAANFVNSMVGGRRLGELKSVISREIRNRRQEIDELAAALVESGLVIWDDLADGNDRLIVRGRGNLIESNTNEEQLERIKSLFDDLERKKDIAEFLELAENGSGVRIFIGSENKLFSLSGSSLVVSHYMNADRKIMGAVGVIGPTRLNYGRIVPIVNYTAQLVGSLVSEGS